MPHIHTKPGQHDLTTTAFIVRIDNGVPVGLLHLHKKLKLLLPPGGHVETDETPWAAALHEIEEEAGFTPRQLRVLQPVERIKKMSGVKVHPTPLFLQTHRFSDDMDHFHTDVGFLFVADDAPTMAPAEGESTELYWMTNDEIQSRKHEMPEDIADIYDFSLTTAIGSWESVALDEFDA